MVGFGDRLRDDDTFTGGEAVGFHNNRRTVLSDVRASICRIIENAGGSGGNVVFEKKLFGENFTAFESRGGLSRAEHTEIFRLKCVGDTGAQSGFRTDDGEVNPLLRRERRKLGDLGNFERHALGKFGDAGIAGRAE